MTLKSLLALGALAAASLASAQVIAFPATNALLAGWDFDNLPNNSASSSVLGAIAARYSDVTADVSASQNLAASMGTAYFNGTFGSSTWQGGNNGARGVSGFESTLNNVIQSRPSGTKLGDITGTGYVGEMVLAVNPNSNPANPDRFSFVVDASSATGLSVSYAARTTSSGPTFTIDWYYQVGASGSPTFLGSNAIATGTTYNAYSQDFSSAATLDGASQAVLIAEVRQTAGTTAQLFMNNVQVIGASVVPEPSSVAALIGASALALAALRRRKAQA